MILVDGVGSAEGMQIVGTRRVADPRFTMGEHSRWVLLKRPERLTDAQEVSEPQLTHRFC